MVVNLLICLFFTLSLSERVYWTEWSTTTIVENGVTKYPGVMHVKRPDGTTLDVRVKYSSTKPVYMVQSNSGVDYWKSGQNNANSPYISPEVDNDPTAYSIITMRYAGTQTIEFDRPMANVFLAFISNNGNTYTFNQNFKITSQGTTSPKCGYWGCGNAVWGNPATGQYTLTWVSGEPHGVIGFTGSFSSFSFDSKIDEFWNGFTIGTYGLSEDVYPPTGCVDYLSIGQSSAFGCCPLPSLYCVKLLAAKPEANQASEYTCTQQNAGTGSFTIAKSGQRVFLSSDSKGTKAPYFDELAVLAVRSPTGNVRGSNYISWQSDCQNTTFTSTAISNSKTPTGPAQEITTLFGNEVGTFSLDISVFNMFSPYSNLDAWVCTGSTLPPGTNAMSAEIATDARKMDADQMTNGLSVQMTVMVAILSAVGTSMLIVGAMMIAGYSVVKKGSNSVSDDLKEQLNQ